MDTLHLSNASQPLAHPAWFDQIAAAIASSGYAILPSALPLPLLDALYILFSSFDETALKTAGTGRDDTYQVNQAIRQDEIFWLEHRFPETVAYQDWAETLRLNLNRRLFLGLFDYECHYAHYPVGAFYRKHIDAFQDSPNRVLSTVLYLNPDWHPGDGGELVLYDESGEKHLEIIAPTYGKLVVFLSQKFPHEVLPAQRSRHSIAGWFRINNNLGTHLDPPR